MIEDVGQTPVHATLTLNADAVIAPALRAMRLSSEMMSIGLAALETADLSNPPPLTAGFFALGFEGVEDPVAKKTQYTAWLLAKGFQELARGLRATLEEAYVFVNVPKLIQNPMTLSDLQAGMAGVQRKANKLNFPDLTAAVQEDLQGPMNFVEEFTSLNRVRNCLEHRHGIVGQTDLDVGEQVMRLRIPRLKVMIQQQGEAEVELIAPLHVQKKSIVSVTPDSRERQFVLGETITFDAAQFQEVAMGCWFFANDIGTKLPKPAQPPAS